MSMVTACPVEVEYPREIAGRPMGSYIEWMRSCSRITVTGCPALSVPAGFTRSGLPVGLQLVARYRAERDLLRIGHAVERTLGASIRRPPLLRRP
jgi:amidase